MTRTPLRKPDPYYDEAQRAYAKLAAIIRAYDAYSERRASSAGNEYRAFISAVNDARSIMGPQFRRNSHWGGG